MVFWAYAALGTLKFFLTHFLSSKCERGLEATTQLEVQSEELISEIIALLLPEEDTPPKNATEEQHKPSAPAILPILSRETEGIVIKLGSLSALDSLASGLTPYSWITYYFNRRFGLSEGQVGILFSAAGILSSLSNLVAPALVRRIGLVQTMVFTHLPASLALAAIPLPNNAGLAMVLLLFRANTNSMDQAPRQTFLAAVMGIVNVVRTLSQSAGPAATGVFVHNHMFGLAFAIAGALKILYDVLMLNMFLSFRIVEAGANAA